MLGNKSRPFVAGQVMAGGWYRHVVGVLCC